MSFVHRSGLGPRVFAALAAAVLLLALIAGSVAAAVSPGALRDSYVAPRHGTPATVIRFSVTFQGHGDRADAHVDLLIDGVGHAMAPSTDVVLLQGVRFRSSLPLPVGTHTVAFSGDDGQTHDTLAAGFVTIEAGPSPDPGTGGGGGGTNPGGQPGPTTTPPAATPTPPPAPTPMPTAPAPPPAPTPKPEPTAAPTADPTAPVAPGATPTPGGGGSSDGAGPTPGSSTGGAQATSSDSPGAADQTSGPGGGPATGGSPAGAPPTAGREYDSAGAIASSPTPSPIGLALGLTGKPGADGGGSGGSGGSGPTGVGLDDRTLSLLTGNGGDIPPATRMLVAAITTTTATTVAAAFFMFGKRRRDGEPPEPDDVLAAKAARLSDRPASSLVPVDAPGAGRSADEAAIPRWRRPSLIEARKADPRYADTTTHDHMSFNHGGDPATAGTERRKIRYRAVSLLDAPDPLRSAAIGDLDEGDEVQLLQRSGGYWLVLCPDGTQGWVHRMTLGDVVEYEGGSSTFSNARKSFASRSPDAGAGGTVDGGPGAPAASGSASGSGETTAFAEVDRSIAEDGTDLLSAYIARRHATFGEG